MTDEKTWQPVTTSVRAFLAPVDRAADAGTIFDPTTASAFDVAAPPEPWMPLGEIENFQRTASDEMSPVASGAEAAVIGQFRKKLEARVSFEMRRWGKLQLAVATGGIHWNVLAPAQNAAKAAVGGAAQPASHTVGGSSAQRLKLKSDEMAGFAAGDLIVVDIDLVQQDGYVGLANYQGYVSPESDKRPGVDFIRRVSCNLSRIAAVEGDELVLEYALIAGEPPVGAGVQKVIGFADREGGLFRQEWSALFVEDTVMGGRVFYYYPRLQSTPPATERRVPIAGDYKALALQAHLLALPEIDSQDGAAALWYRTYIPPAAGSW